ncbi:MAG TPA: hypothetical protein VMN03_08250, partial [Burkholderiales bacterium]|nr:hypothetical protein [Burkholderiales bacterium]
ALLAVAHRRIENDQLFLGHGILRDFLPFPARLRPANARVLRVFRPAPAARTKTANYWGKVYARLGAQQQARQQKAGSEGQRHGKDAGLFRAIHDGNITVFPDPRNGRSGGCNQ